MVSGRIWLRTGLRKGFKVGWFSCLSLSVLRFGLARLALFPAGVAQVGISDRWFSL